MNIKIKSIYCERFGDNITQQILSRSFPVKTGYWISRALEKIRQESKTYFSEKEKLIEKYKDQERHNAENNPQPGRFFIKDFQAFQKELIQLQEAELDLGIEKIKVNLNELEAWFKENGEKDLTVGELEYLLPFFEIE